MRSRWAQCVIFSILVLAGGFLLSAPHVFAQTDSAAQVAAQAGLGSADLPTIIGRIISVFLGLLGVVFLILVLYGGIVWMTAAGDEKLVEKAKKILIQATVGLVITMLAYAITAFIVNVIGDATGGGSNNGGNGGVSVETLSGALGAGPVQDHYPTRNQLDVPRNTRISITFKEAIDTTTITTSSVKIYTASGGSATALTDTQINFTDDHKTFVFKPAEYLGSPSEDVQYKVHLTSDIKNASGVKIFASSTAEYEWSFTTGTILDLTPPTVLTSMPANAGTYARNIAVQATFSEAVDPTSASGITTAAGGFSNITIIGGSGSSVAGEYQISNSYTGMTFVSNDPCGTNSCGVTILCLPKNDALTVTVKSATTTIDPPQADAFPYNGVVDMAGNALDGNHDGSAGDSYVWDFSTTGDINKDGPTILSISPIITEENVPLDQSVTLTFGDILMTSSVTSDNVALSNTETSSHTSHEMWFVPGVSYLTADGDAVTTSTQVPAQTLVKVSHGTFLESVDGKSYEYGTTVTDGILNQYQNCYVPGNGPNKTGGACNVTDAKPFCCNGSASATACALF